MPIYEYRCTKCNKEFEYQQRMSDPPKKKCEECKGRLERLISRAAFQLKGGGWYKDLYASTKPSDSSSKDSGGGQSTSDGGSTAGGSSTGTSTKSGDSAAKKKASSKGSQ